MVLQMSGRAEERVLAGVYDEGIVYRLPMWQLQQMPTRKSSNQFLLDVNFSNAEINRMVEAHSNRYANRNSEKDLFKIGLEMYRERYAGEGEVNSGLVLRDYARDSYPLVRAEIVSAMELLHQTWKPYGRKFLQELLDENYPLTYFGLKCLPLLRERAMEPPRSIQQEAKQKSLLARIDLLERYENMGRDIQGKTLPH